MKKYEVTVEENKAEEFTAMLQNLPYVKRVEESAKEDRSYTFVSESSLAEGWLSAEDDELQKLYGK